MKKFFLSMSLMVAVAAILVSCGGGNSPKGNAEKFLKAFYTYDFEAAKAVGTEDTKAFLGQFASMTAMMPDSLKEIAKKSKVEINDKGITEDGNTAMVPYKFTPADGSSEPIELKLKMVKEDKKWLAVMTKEELEKQANEQKAKLQTEENTLNEVDSVLEGPDAAAADTVSAK